MPLEIHKKARADVFHALAPWSFSMLSRRTQRGKKNADHPIYK